jgi:hypothetical protein
MHEPSPCVVIVVLGENGRIGHAEIAGEAFGVERTDTEGDQCPGVAKDRMLQRFGKLSNLLVRRD